MNLLHWLGFAPVVRRPVRPPAPDQPPGPSTDLDRLFGLVDGRESLRKCSGLLPDLDPAKIDLLVGDVARRFLAYAVDLPASEDYHHSEPFGLARHSLEVAEDALRRAQTEFFVTHTRTYPEEEYYRRPRLRYACWLFGLCHDGGKVAQFRIEGPGHARWNLYLESLSDFYARHGRKECTWTWKPMRGPDAHVWETAYLQARLLTPAVAAYLGPDLLTELIEKTSPAAQRLYDLILEADHASVGKARARQVAFVQEEARAQAPAAPVLGVAVGEYIDRIPAILAQAIVAKALSVDGIAGDVLVGEKFLLLKYPNAVKVLGTKIREALERESTAARRLTPDEDGARELADYLHRWRKLWADPETDTWKVKATIESDAGSLVEHAILIPRAFVEPALAAARALPRFAGKIAFARAKDGLPVAPDDFKGSRAPLPAGPVAAAAPPGLSRSSEISTRAPQTAPPPAPARLAPPVSAPLSPSRTFVSPEGLLSDLRTAILEGWLPTNVTAGQCYVLAEVAFIAWPKGFERLVEKGLYPYDVGRQGKFYLDALDRLACVRKPPTGRVLTQILLDHASRPLWAVAFDKKGLFRDADEIARVGVWTKTPLRELSPAEVEAFAKARAIAGPLAPRAAALSPEAAHA